MVLEIISLVFAMIFILEGAIVAFNPRWTKAITHKIMRNRDTIRTIGALELIAGFILLFLYFHYIA